MEKHLDRSVVTEIDAKTKKSLKIKNKSLINHVYEKAKSTNIGQVYVATGDQEIFDEVVNNILDIDLHGNGVQETNINQDAVRLVQAPWVALLTDVYLTCNDTEIIKDENFRHGRHHPLGR